MKTKNLKKVKFLRNIAIRKVIIRIIYIIFLVAILYNLMFVVHKSITKKEYLQIFGISFFNMSEKLMEGDINKNDLVIVKEIKENEIKTGDIIAYNISGKIRINKVVNQYYDDKIGKIVYITKSNKNIQPDIEPIQLNQIIGKKIINIPIIGVIIEILQTKLVSVIVLIIFVISYFSNKYFYNKKKERKRKLRREERQAKMR